MRVATFVASSPQPLGENNVNVDHNGLHSLVCYIRSVQKKNQVHIRVSDLDKASIESEANKLGLSISSYVLLLHRQYLMSNEENRRTTVDPEGTRIHSS